MVLVVLFILLILMYLILKNANRNKYISIVVLYLCSTAMIILVGLMYKSRISQYNFPLNIDYVLYTFLRTMRLSVRTLSRLYNFAFAFFMASGLCCIITLDLFKRRLPAAILLSVPILLFVIYNDPQVYSSIYIDAVYYGSSFWSGIMKIAGVLNPVIVYGYTVAPIAALVVYYIRTVIFTKRRDSMIYGICLLVITMYNVYVCFISIYRDILFWKVDIARLPIYPEYFGAYVNFMILTFAVIAIVVLLIVYFEPFNTISIINLRNKRESKKEMERNFAMVLHEYKNAFIGVKHFLNLANSNLEKENYDMVQKTVIRGLDIVKDNLESINRLGSTIGFHGKSYAKTNIIHCIQKAMSNRSVYEFAKVGFESCEDEIYVFGDEKRLTEIFENLFLNSIEALSNKEPDKARITVSILAEKDAVMITITDNGVGIAKKDLKKIFSIFYSTKSGNNSGVGLNYVLKELQNNNGEIRATSKYGEYTSMQIVLPVYKERRNLKWLKKSKL